MRRTARLIGMALAFGWLLLAAAPALAVDRLEGVGSYARERATSGPQHWLAGLGALGGMMLMAAVGARIEARQRRRALAARRERLRRRF